MNVHVVRRGNVLQFHTEIQVDDRTYPFDYVMEFAGDAALEAALVEGEGRLLEEVRSGLLWLFLHGQKAQEVSAKLQIGEKTITAPPDKDHGICRVCMETFRLHYIANTRDLCMKHINPMYI